MIPGSAWPSEFVFRQDPSYDADLHSALCPTPPFDQLNFLRIDALLAPAFIASLFISYYAVYKILGLMMGVILFGQPILDPTIRWLDTRFPCWRQALLPKQ